MRETMMTVAPPLRRTSRRHAGLVVDQRHFAEDAALADGGEHDAFVFASGLDDFDLSSLDHVGAVSLVALLEKSFPGLTGLAFQNFIGHGCACSFVDRRRPRVCRSIVGRFVREFIRFRK